MWSDTGVEPASGDEPIQGGARYPAEWLNWILWATTTDIDTAFTDISNLESNKLDATSYTPEADTHDKVVSADISHDDTSGGTRSDAHHTKTQPSDVDSSNWGGYDIQVNGTDGQGIINLKTN